jgi:hypothetical protein
MIHTFTVQLKNPKSCTNTIVAYVYACKCHHSNSFPSILTQSEPRVRIITITKPVILPKWIQVCINQLLNPFTTFLDEEQQIKQNKAKYIVFTHIGRAREHHRGYGSNSLWIDQSGSFFNPVWPEPLNDGSGYEIVKSQEIAIPDFENSKFSLTTSHSYRVTVRVSIYSIICRKFSMFSCGPRKQNIFSTPADSQHLLDC